MVSPELADYIKKSLHEGHSPESIRKALLDSGWPAEQADEAINQVASRQQPTSVPHKKEKVKQKKSRKILFIILIIIAIGVVGVSLWIYFTFFVLYNIGIFNPDAFTAKTPTGFTTLGAPDDWDLDSSGYFVIILQNRLDSHVEIKRIEISTDSSSDYYEPSSPIIIDPGSNRNLLPSESRLSLGPQQKGKTYSIDVEILYNSGGFDRTETGTVTGTVS